MPKKIEMLGKTYNYWTILKQAPNNNFNKTTWLYHSLQEPLSCIK
jgi:hypothetical protein